MNWKEAMLGLLSAGLVGVALLYARARLEYDHKSADSTETSQLGLGSSGQTAAPADPPPFQPGFSHRPTEAMMATSREQVGKTAPAREASDAAGVHYHLLDPARTKSLALVFIKSDCPCSRAAQPYFNQLFQAYGQDVLFLGVINGSASAARDWGSRNEVPFPILCDQELAIVHAFHVENSGYLVIVRPDGSISDYWPGFSGEMLETANQKLAESAGRPSTPMRFPGAPVQLFTGCPY